MRYRAIFFLKFKTISTQTFLSESRLPDASYSGIVDLGMGLKWAAMGLDEATERQSGTM